MRNLFLFLGAGLVALAAISLGSASRYAYHLYQFQRPYKVADSHTHRTPHRPSSNRIAPWRYYQYKTLSRQEKDCDAEKTYLKYQPYKPSSVAINYKETKRLKALKHPEQYARYLNNLQNEVYIVRKGDYKEVFPLYNQPEKVARISQLAPEDAYIINTEGFTKDSQGVYRTKNTSLAFRVLKPNLTCTPTNILACSRNLTQQFQKTQNIKNIQSILSRLRWRQTQDLDFAYYPTVEESSYGTVNGRKLVYFIFTAVNPKDHTIIRIEAVADPRDEDRAARKAYEIFESFRFPASN